MTGPNHTDSIDTLPRPQISFSICMVPRVKQTTATVTLK